MSNEVTSTSSVDPSHNSELYGSKLLSSIHGETSWTTHIDPYGLLIESP